MHSSLHALDLGVTQVGNGVSCYALALVQHLVNTTTACASSLRASTRTKGLKFKG